MFRGEAWDTAATNEGGDGRTISTKTWIASGLMLAALVAVALLPLSASAADRQEVSFEISGIPCGVTIADGSPPVVRTTKSVCGLASGTGSGLCCEGGADFDYTVNVAQMRGAVAGTWAISGNIDDVIWQGELRGSVGPDGAAGVLSGHANTGWTLHGTWRYDGFSDPTADTGGGFEATAVVSS